jgi:hypothetical protein
MLDLQGNQYISGALPKSMFIGTVATCSTDISCASTMGRGPLLSIVCVPKADMDRISQATVSAVEIATLFSSFPYDCAATTTTIAPSAGESRAPLTPPSPLSVPPASTAVASSLTQVALYISVGANSGGSVGAASGFVRGAVPSLQRASAALRLAAKCQAERAGGDDMHQEDSSDASFGDALDNPLLLTLTVGQTRLAQSAAGAVVGNTVLVVGFGVLSHALGCISLYVSERETGRVVRFLFSVVLPSSMLPGAVMAPFSMLLQPTVSASIVLVAHSLGRTAGTVVLSVLLGGIVWGATSLCVALQVCWRWPRVKGDALVCTPCVETMITADTTSPQHGRKLRKYLLQVSKFWLAENGRWILVSQGNGRDSSRNIQLQRAKFFYTNLLPVFEPYTQRRRWFFALEWALAATSGFVTGGAIVAAEMPGGACSAATWSSCVSVALIVVEVSALCWFRPFRVRGELAAAVCVSVCGCISCALAFATDGSSVPEDFVLAGAVMQLLFMAAIFLHGAVVWEKETPSSSFPRGLSRGSPARTAVCARSRSVSRRPAPSDATILETFVNVVERDHQLEKLIRLVARQQRAKQSQR